MSTRYNPVMVYTQGTGASSTKAFLVVFNDRDPTDYDVNYDIQQRWVNTATGNEWILYAYNTTESQTFASWIRIGPSATGDIIGPASSTDQALVRFDGTTGKLAQNSVAILSDEGALSGLTQVSVDNLQLDGNTLSSTDTDGDINLTPDGTGIVTMPNGSTAGGGYIYHAGGTDVALADGGTGASLADPGADRILFWDESANAMTWLTAGTGLSITDTTISTVDAGGDVTGPASSTDNALARFDSTTGKIIQNSVAILGDTGNLSGLTQINVDNIEINGNAISSTDTNGNIDLTPNGTGLVRYNGTSVNGGFRGINEGEYVGNNTEFQLITTSNGAGIWGYKAASNGQGQLRFKTHSSASTPVLALTIDENQQATFVSNVTIPNTGLHLLDTNASHDLIVAPGSDLTDDRTFTLTTGDSNRTLTMTGDATLNQDVSTAAGPTFAGDLTVERSNGAGDVLIILENNSGAAGLTNAEIRIGTSGLDGQMKVHFFGEDDYSVGYDNEDQLFVIANSENLQNNIIFSNNAITNFSTLTTALSTRGLASDVIRTGGPGLISQFGYLTVAEPTVPFTLTMPVSPREGEIHKIKDGSGDASTNPITIEGSGIQNFDQSWDNIVINNDYGYVEVMWSQQDGTWWITSKG